MRLFSALCFVVFLAGTALCEWCGDEDCYDILKITQRASQADIKDAYRKLSKQFHPDKNPTAAQERFKLIAKAYEVLSDERKRSRYDYAIRNPDGWIDEDGNYNDAPGDLNVRVIAVCLLVCFLFLGVIGKWVTDQEFWHKSPPKSKKSKKAARKN